MKQCINTYETCNEYYARGMCKNCYGRWQNRGTTDYKVWPKPTETCAGPECDRLTKNAYSDLCAAHWSQRWRGMELKPLRWYKPAELGIKVCSRCFERKLVDDFYIRTNGSPWSYCKACNKKRLDAKKAVGENE